MGFTVAMVTFRIPADLNSFGVPVLRLEVCLLRGVFQCYCYILGIRSPVCHYYTCEPVWGWDEGGVLCYPDSVSSKPVVLAIRVGRFQ